MPPEETSSSGRRRRRWIIAGVIAVLLAAAAIAIAIGRSGFTLPLDGAGPWIERRLAAAVAPLRVRAGGLVLRWEGVASPVVVRAERWALLRADGEPFVDLPRVEVALAQRALLRRELLPQWATVAGPRLLLDRGPEGDFAPALEDFGGALGDGDSSAAAELLAAWLAETPSGPLARLELVRVEDASIVVRDRALALDWGLDGLSAEVSRQHVETLEVAGTLRAGNAASSVELPFTGAVELRHRRLGLALTIADVELARLAALHPTLAPLGRLDARLAGTARLAIDQRLDADPIELTLAPSDGSAPLSVRARASWLLGSSSFSAAASAEHFDAAACAALSPTLAKLAPLLPPLMTRVELESSPERSTMRAELRAPAGEGPFSRLSVALGRPAGADAADLALEVEALRPSRLATLDAALAPLRGLALELDGGLRGTLARERSSLALELSGAGGRLDLEGEHGASIPVDSLALSGSLAGPAAALRLGRGELRVASGAVSASADVRPAGRGHAASVRIAAARLERADLDRWWPIDLEPEARAEVAETFLSGALADITLDAEVDVEPAGEPPVRLAGLEGSAALDRVELDLLPPQPPLVLDGRARLDLDAVTATVERAGLGDVELGPAAVRIVGWRGDEPALTVETRWRGRVEPLLALLAAEPLSVLGEEEVRRLAGASGSARGELSIESRLGAESASQARVRASGEIEDLAWPDGPLGLAVSAGAARFSYGADEVLVEGDSVLGSSPTRFSVRHRLDQAEPRDLVRLSSRLDLETARSLGVPEQGFAGGSIGIEATYRGHGDGSSEVEADLDLGPATIEVREAGWTKPGGEAATARVEVAIDAAGSLDARSLVVDARDLEASASLLATTGPFRLESATVDRLRLGRSELVGSLRRRDDGGLSVDVDATRLDLRALLEDDPPPTEGDAIPGSGAGAVPTETANVEPASAAAASAAVLGVPFDFRARAGSLLLLHDLETRRFDGEGSWSGERWDRLSVHGAFDGDTSLALDYDRGASAGAIAIATDDFGGLLAALVSRSEISGGALRIEGRPAAAGSLVGRVELRSFTLVEMPVFASILRLGTLDSLIGLFESKGLEFKSLEADLEWDGRRLALTEGRAVGAGIALTGEGTFDLAAGTVDFSGTVAHMGAVQRMVAKVPLLSQLVLGRDRAGVVATRFRLTGATTDPQVRVEPLSTFTPGFLRDLFGGSGRRNRRADEGR